MIKFRQKEFIAPLVAAGARMAASALPSLALEGGLGIAANKAQEKANQQQTEIMQQQAEQQAAANKQMQKTLDKIAEKADKNPQGAVQAAGQALQQRQYARLGKAKIATFLKRDVGGFAKDVGKMAWNRKNIMIGGTLAGAGMAASSYAADKAVQHDMKKSGIPLEKRPETKQKEYSASKFGKGVLSGVKKAGKVVKDAAKANKGMIVTTSALGALPVVSGYAAEKEQLKAQIKDTKKSAPETRSYSIIRGVSKWLKGAGKTLKKNWGTFKKHPGQSTLGWVSNNIGQGGGRKEVMNFGKELEQRGLKSGSKLSQKAGKFIYTNPKTSLVGSTVIGLGVMANTWDRGEKTVKGLAKKLDKDAYAYQESKDQEIQ